MKREGRRAGRVKFEMFFICSSPKTHTQTSLLYFFVHLEKKRAAAEIQWKEEERERKEGRETER